MHTQRTLGDASEEYLPTTMLSTRYTEALTAR